MKIVPNFFFTILTTILATASCFANDPPPPQAVPPGGPPGPPGTPIDSGIVLMIVAAVFYGIYKIYQYNSIKKALN